MYYLFRQGPTHNLLLSQNLIVIYITVDIWGICGGLESAQNKVKNAKDCVVQDTTVTVVLDQFE